MEGINLYHLLKFYVKNWRIIFVVTLVGLVAGFLYSTVALSPEYRSQATLLMTKSSGSPAQDSVQINNYVEIVTSRRVLEPAGQTAGIDYSYDQAYAAITASNEKDTQVISVSATTPSADKSKALLDATLESFDTQVEEIYINNGQLRVVDNASIPVRAENINTPLQAALGAAIGLLAGVIALFFVFDYRASRDTSPVDETTAAEQDTAHDTAPLALHDTDTPGSTLAGDGAFSANSYGTLDDEAPVHKAPRPSYLRHFMALITGINSPAYHTTPPEVSQLHSTDVREEQAYVDNVLDKDDNSALEQPSAEPMHFEAMDPTGLPLPPSDLTEPIPDLPPELTALSDPDFYDGHEHTRTDTASEEFQPPAQAAKPEKKSHK